MRNAMKQIKYLSSKNLRKHLNVIHADYKNILKIRFDIVALINIVFA